MCTVMVQVSRSTPIMEGSMELIQVTMEEILIIMVILEVIKGRIMSKKQLNSNSWSMRWQIKDMIKKPSVIILNPLKVAVIKV